MASVWDRSMSRAGVARKRRTMCTTMTITKGATANGSMVVTHSDDDEPMGSVCGQPGVSYPRHSAGSAHLRVLRWELRHRQRAQPDDGRVHERRAVRAAPRHRSGGRGDGEARASVLLV